jgi:hypothetical protein
MWLLMQSRKPFPDMVRQAISSVQSQWLDQVVDSYTADEYSQGLIAKLVVDSTSVQHFAWNNGLLRYKGRIWVGMDTQPHMKLISAFYCSTGGGGGALKDEEGCAILLSLSAGQT